MSLHERLQEIAEAPSLIEQRDEFKSRWHAEADRAELLTEQRDTALKQRDELLTALQLASLELSRLSKQTPGTKRAYEIAETVIAKVK